MREARLADSYDVYYRPVYQLPTAPSFVEAWNEWGYEGARCRGNARAFSIRGANCSRERIKAFPKFPLPVEAGARILPGDIREAASIAAGRGKRLMWAFREDHIVCLGEETEELLPANIEIRGRRGPDRIRKNARLHIPPLASLLKRVEMGGRAWIRQFADGLSMIGDVAEPGARPASSAEEPTLSRGGIIRSAKDGARRREDRNAQTSIEPWEDAIKQVARRWLEGPFEYRQGAKLRVGGKPLEVNPAYRSGVRQGEELRAVDDLKRSATNKATAARAPIDLPSWDHITQTCEPYSRKGGRRPLGMAKADHADACRQLPLREEAQLTAVVTLQRPRRQARYGFI